MGITIYEIATGNPPLADHDPKTVLTMIPKMRPVELGTQYSPALREFVKLCLTMEPDERPGADELLKTKLVKSVPRGAESMMKELITRYQTWKLSHQDTARPTKDPTEELG